MISRDRWIKNVFAIGFLGVAILMSTVFVLSGCSPLVRAVSTTKDPGCPTIVEGVFHSRVGYNGEYPALCARIDGRLRILHHRYSHVGGSGVLYFFPRESAFYPPDSVFIPVNDILWEVDTAGNVVMGSIPDEKQLTWDMEMLISSTTHPHEDDILLRLKPNARFSYCLKPGEYEIKMITLHARNEYKDKCEESDLPNMIFTVAPDVVNYIGDIFLDLDRAVPVNGCAFTTFAVRRPGDGGLAPLTPIDHIVLMLKTNDPRDHILCARADTNFRSNLGTPFTTSLITIECKRTEEP